MLNKLNKEVKISTDKLVIIEPNGTADIASVYEVDHEKIYAESSNFDYNVPIGDVKSYVGNSGRIYVLQADPEYIQDTRRLAELEKSIVLKHVTQFEKVRETNEKINMKQIMLYVLIGVLLLGVLFK